MTALSWACAAQVSAFDLMVETIGAVIGRLKAAEHAQSPNDPGRGL